MARAPQQTTTPALQPAPAPTNGNPLPQLLDAMQQAIDAVAAHAAQCGVQEWQRIRKARRAINDVLATIEGRERKAK
jgi:hypothetical protein